jgi:hypothetical protein
MLIAALSETVRVARRNGYLRISAEGFASR